MIRNFKDIVPVSTSHGVGRKRVLLSSNESGCSLTQIAITELSAGEIATAHVHPDMQEAFYVISGEIEVTLDGRPTTCAQDTFVYVDKCTSHELRANIDSRIMTIGCVIEDSRKKFYPMLFKQNRKILLWGTEDWTVSGVTNSESEVENGTWARYNLTDVIARRPQEILGKQVAAKYNNQLPLLTKIIDAHQDLSIQVHPDDEMAAREHNKLGKSEMWYILDAKPGAYLYAGFKQHITPKEYKERVANGTICDVLAKHEVHKGDVFFLPAGRIHAICGGIRLAEIQQSSDLTYRIYDYNRLGLDGKPRELHTELAAQAIDYEVYPEYKTEHRENIDAANELLNTPYFSVKIVEATKSIHRNMVKYDSFVIIMCIQGNCKVHIRSTGDEVTIAEGSSCLIPAVVADYDIIPFTHNAKVLEAFINNRKSIGKLISDFFHIQ
jgi:phosphomannose isomerase type I